MDDNSTWSMMILNNNNTNNNSNNYIAYEDRPETYIVPVLFCLIFIIGVLGNGTLVIIFLRHRAIRNIPNIYIFSLALADLLVILTCVPFTSVLYTLESWPWGVTVCKISETTKNVSIGVSVFTLTALSIERYSAIVNPLRKFQTKSSTFFCAVLIWIVAICLALPDAIFARLEYAKVQDGKIITYCYPFPNITNVAIYAKYNIVLKSLIYYFIPLSIISLFYILMAARLRDSINELSSTTSDVKRTAHDSSIARQANARKHVATMVLIFVFLFFICFLPHHVFMLWYHLTPTAEDDYNDWWHALRIIGFCLSFLNSCVNPIALYCVSALFRRYFHLYLCCNRNREKQQRNSTVRTNLFVMSSFNSTIRKYTRNATSATLDKSLPSSSVSAIVKVHEN